MAYLKRLGIFARIPEPGLVKTRLAPELTETEACELYRAFLRDFFARVERLKKCAITVFYAGGDPSPLRDIVPGRFALRPQSGHTLGERLHAALSELLDHEGATAVVVGSDSPDLPIAYLKRAFRERV